VVIEGEEMNKLLQNIENQWQHQGVKYIRAANSLKWHRTIRSADCAICGKHQTEKKINMGFLNWGLLIHVSDVAGKAPEVCPSCMKLINRNLIPPPRFAECQICHVRQREKIYGIGWPGWNQLFPFGKRSDREIVRNLACPNCNLKLAKKLGKKFVRGTWTDLTYASGSLLTSTKMTQNQANFAALGAGDSGAPDVYNLKSGLDASKSASPAVGDVYIATDTSKTYACYTAGAWTQLAGTFTEVIDTVYLPADVFVACEGSPTLTTVGDGVDESCSAWALDPNAAEAVGTSYINFAYASSFYKVLPYFTKDTQISQQVRLCVRLRRAASNAPINADHDQEQCLDIGTSNAAWGICYGECTVFSLGARIHRWVVRRDATHAQDTYTGDAYFLGLHIMLNYQFG
jgi:hypothetical protein